MNSVGDDINQPRFSKLGETSKHASLKLLAMAWARDQGMTITASEISFPHRKFRVDAAACLPARKTPSRTPKTSIISVLKAAAIFECKQARGDLIRDNKRRTIISERLKALEERKVKLEELLQVHLPHLAKGESLFPQFDSYRFPEYRHAGYRKLAKQIAVAKHGIIDGTKFDRLFSYRLANLHYLVVEEALLEPQEVPTGWGLLVREGEELSLMKKPAWLDINVETQLIFLQRIAARKSYIGISTSPEAA
jgi:hypothetical protein